MRFAADGSFKLPISTKALALGIDSRKTVPKNGLVMEQLSGMIGDDGLLQSLPELVRITAAGLSESFPFPQLFVLTKRILICGESDIYEWDGSTLSHQLTVTAGNLWSVVDYYDYIYMSNGEVAVVRDSVTDVYRVESGLPSFLDICNYNGQVMVVAPSEI